MTRILLFSLFTLVLIYTVLSNVDEEDSIVVDLEQGSLKGVKYWNGDFYEFYGVPYASVPKGKDRFKGPLPVKPWKGVINATNDHIVCPQTFYTGENNDELILTGEEECLALNIFVPAVANENNLVPVLVYIHSGAFAVGSGNMAKYRFIANHDVLVISYNYRLGALGFLCLGNEEIPGNSGMKDQVAALKWINQNIRKFGGDPTKVTVAGFSVGASMAELLALSGTTDGLIDKIILESGSALSPFTINRNPIETATNIAKSLGYNDTGKLEDLTNFYLKASVNDLATKSLNFFLKNSTFGFAPCIENNVEGEEPFLTKSPFDILKSGDFQQVSVLTGFANMEGISRTIKFEEWSEEMNKNFAAFLPADLVFDDEKSKTEIINVLKNKYFNGEDVSPDTLQGYVDYFSDSMFKYSIMKSLKLRSEKTNRPIYLYEFSYFGELNMRHNYMDLVKGASHRDQTAYILDFGIFTNKYNDLYVRQRMTTMWTDFARYEDPTAYESDLVNFKWLKYSNEDTNYLEINKNAKVKKDLFKEDYLFWDKIYTKHYWNPTMKNVYNAEK